MKRTYALALVAVSLAGCLPEAAPTARSQQAERAARAADSVVFEKNAEIDNIQRRLKLTSNPGQIGFVLLINQAGQPIMYTSVRGKITSGSKRLSRPDECWYSGALVDGCYNESQIRQAPSDEGTFGSSDAYVYFWTVDGQYVQWNGGYLYSDKPFRTNTQPLVIAVAEGR
jgi:hypothetical protein